MAVAFSEMVARLSADERKLLDNTFAKYPDLKDSWAEAKEDGLRQADYSRKQNELAAEKKKFESDLDYATRMKAWAEDAVPRYDALVEKGIIDKDTGEELWTVQKEALEKQLKEARDAAVGGEMDPAELDKRVRAIVTEAGGTATKEEIKALYASEGKKMAQEVFDENWKTKEEHFNKSTIPFVSGFSAGVAVVASRYERETGEPWDEKKQAELFEMMNQTQVFDALKLEEKLLAPHKDKKAREKEIQEEVEKRVKTMRESMPGGGDEGFIPQPDQKGALQIALEQSGSGDFESMIRGKAVEAAKALHQEGK